MLIDHVLNRERFFLLLTRPLWRLLVVWISTSCRFPLLFLFAFCATTRVTPSGWLSRWANRIDACSHSLSTFARFVLDARYMLLWGHSGWRKSWFSHDCGWLLSLVKGRSVALERLAHLIISTVIVLSQIANSIVRRDCVVLMVTVCRLPEEQVLGRSVGLSIDNSHSTSILSWLFVHLVKALRLQCLLSSKELTWGRQLRKVILILGIVQWYLSSLIVE